MTKKVGVTWQNSAKQGIIQITLLTVFPIFKPLKMFLSDMTTSNGFQCWRRRGSQEFHIFLPYISLVRNPGGMEIAGARAILEKSSEETYREKTVRGTKNLVN